MKEAQRIDVLAVGFCCYDLGFAVPHHPGEDEKVRATGLVTGGGGPAANAAVTVARLGGRAGFVGRVGRDAFGDVLRAEFAAEGVDVSGLRVTEGHTALATQLVKPDGRRTIVSRRDVLARDEMAPGGPRLSREAVGGVLFDGHEPDLARTWLARAREAGVPVVLDAGTLNDVTRELAAGADHIVASEPFARAALGGREPTLGNLGELAALGSANAVWVVTLGARGLIWRRAGEWGELGAFAVDVVDTTGAGDAFHGAYALAVARGAPWREVLGEASAAGALACSCAGARAGLPTRSQLDALLGN